MKNTLKRITAMLICAVMLAGIVLVAPPATVEAANHGQYGDLALIADQGSCPSMQGLALCGDYFYAIKTDGKDNAAAVCRVNKDTGSKTWLTNSANNTYYFYDFGHGNDMDVVVAGGVTTMIVATSTKGSNSLVRYKISGTTATKVSGYTMVNTSGTNLSGGAIRVARVDDENIYLLFKYGNELYTGTLPISQTGGTITMTYMCTLDYSTAVVNGVAEDTSSWSLQGMGYYDHMLYLPLSSHTTSKVNMSIVLVYDLEGASGTIKPLDDPTFKITSNAYSALFEMESCLIDPESGRLYFNTNRRKTSSDTNHDGIHYITNWLYEPDQRTTEVNNYRWEMINGKLTSVTDGGSVYNGLAMHEGSVSGTTITNGRYATSKTVVLEHDRPWVLEWKSNGCTAGELLFATEAVSNYSGAPYIFVNAKNARVSIGAYDGSQYNNYGVTLADHGIDGSGTHVFRLTNKIASDGSNMVYLSVDGKELGAMNNHHISSTSQGKTSNWVSGKDLRFSYLGTTGHKVNDSIEYIQVWGDGIHSQYDEPNTYRWETQSNKLTSISGLGLTANTATMNSGSCSNGVFSKSQFSLEKDIVLLHDRPWSLEWESEGAWIGGALLFASEQMSNIHGAPYIFRNSGSVLAIGAYDGTGHKQYGVKLTDYGISNADSHIYRLTNRINADGSNMIYLYVDGKEIAPMNSYFVGGSAQGTTSDWVSGRDFTFGYMGTYQHPVNSASMDYIQVWENGIPEEDVADNYRWETQSDKLVNITTGSFAENTANALSGSCANGVYTGSQFALDHSIMLLHDRPWSIEWQAEGNWSGGGLILSNAKNSNAANNTYMFRNSNIIALGTYTGTRHEQWGINLTNQGIDMTKLHTYRLMNRVNADGSNMVYLFVDGVEKGAMNNYFISGSATSTGTSDWVSGKDFVFSYIGSAQHSINATTLNYLQVNEGCAHSFGVWNIVDASCTVDGSKTRTCSLCGEIEKEIVPATGHSWNDATCTTPKTCSLCGETEGNAQGHSYESVTTAPTCTENGRTTYTCTGCGDSYIEIIAASGHKWNDATCTTAKTCSVCGETEGAVLGHNYKGVVTAPTCTKSGYTTYTCTGCGDSYIGNVVPATGHAWSDGICGSCGIVCEHNYQNGICTVCGDKVAVVEDSKDIKWQVTSGTNANSASTNLRLLTWVDTLEDYSSVSFNVTINGKTTKLECTTVYTAILASGVAIRNPANVFKNESANYFVTYTLKNIPSSAFDTPIVVTVTWTDLEGNETTSESKTIVISSDWK